MTAASLSRQSLELGRLLRRAVAWWVGELAGLLPRSARAWLAAGGRSQAILEYSTAQASLRVPARGRGGPATIPLGDGQGSVSTRVARQYGGLPVQVHLDPALVLDTAIDLPAAAERSMEAIVRNQLERLVPLDPATVRFGWQIAERLPARNVLKVRVVIVKQATVERVTALVTRVGLTPRSIVGGQGTALTLWQAHSGQVIGTGQRRLRRGLEVGAALLLVAAYAVHVARLDRRHTTLRAAVATAHQQAVAVQAIGQQADQASAALAFFTAKRAVATPLAVLDALTAAVPHDSWVSDVHLHGAEVELTGYAPHATDFVARIEALPLFSDPVFKSPVTLVQGGTGERFELGFRVRVTSP